MTDLYAPLKEAQESDRLPRITAFNRIDGPGSSLDLREFQQAFWSLPEGPMPDDDDGFAVWSRGLPRTVGITIDVGCVVEARPLSPGRIGIVSHDYGYTSDMPAGQVPYRKELWLLKMLDTFGLSGVQFHLHNLAPGIKSSGLGGSATAATAVCLLANELAKEPFNAEQIVALASMLEQDMGVSLTGTQEQSNVVFGGVTDYVWFPWGLPGSCGTYGTSVRRTLLQEADYPELAARMRIYHSGTERASTDVNCVWRERLCDDEGYGLHRTKLAIAHDFAEGLRKKEWDHVSAAIGRYRKVRVELCPEYMTGKCWDLQGQCEAHGAESFPLGAGGGGAVLIFSPSPEQLAELDEVLSRVFRRIDFRIRSRGHEFANLPR